VFLFESIDALVDAKLESKFSDFDFVFGRKRIGQSANKIPDRRFRQRVGHLGREVIGRRQVSMFL
jgi:hypothetical protein